MPIIKKYVLILIGLLVIVLIPRIIWGFLPKHEEDIVILDKTVPTVDRREHRGLSWLLNHYRYMGAGDENDYYGYVPEKKEARPLPDDLGDTKYIYVADTYGVYDESGERPRLVYGGLQAEEWNTIKQHVSKKETTLIMEFNTLASPTSKDVQKDAAAFLHVQPTGWTGRWFDHLKKDNPEINASLVDQYEASGHDWTFEGSGFVLVHEEDERVIVLSDEAGDVLGEGISLSFTENGEAMTGLKESAAYRYWFDITVPVYPEEVIANYEWALSTAGREKLNEAGIPVSFPAAVHHTNGSSHIFYFAGDYADIQSVSSVHRYAGFAKMRAALTPASVYPDEAFYWKTYVPMMKAIMELQAPEAPDKQEMAKENGLSYISKVNGDRFEVYRDGKWVSLPIKGVNLGMGKPGAFPGEAAITEEEYYRWLTKIGEMNANTIRVYTIHPPGFYNALKRYNEEYSNKPIYLFHGVWIDEGPLEETLDAFTPEITETFQKEMKTIADVIHGRANLPKKVGHSSGTYRSNVSPYVIGWIIGIEWYPYMVDNMKKKHTGMADYNGRFMKTENANPMEIWLARQMDLLMGYEADTYGWTRPMSFTNWVTTDLLDHPAEPSEQEDLASVDPNKIIEKQGPGMYASYHVYPYYPDFLNLDEKYTKYKDHRGENNNYAGYLHDLRAAHDMPVLIAEFGIPGSRGMAHRNTYGWNQGFISEKQQGNMLVRLYDDILEEGMMGGLVFTWQDEWFKRTWNTMELDDPDRRPYWSNTETNEQQFGLMSFDRLKVKTDGKTEDWKDETPLYEEENQSLNKLFVTHDERHLYVRMDVKDAFNGRTPMLFFDVNPLIGSKNPRVANGLSFNESNADYVVKFDGKESGQLLVDAYYDIFLYQYGFKLHMMEPKPAQPVNNGGVFNPIRFALNKEMIRPDTNETLPFEYYETGKLRFGNSNPEAKEYDSLADYYYDEQNGVFEIRIPWLLLNVKDPSTLLAAGDLFKVGMNAEETIKGIGVSAALIEDDGTIQTLPKSSNGVIKNVETYTWAKWNEPQYIERLKQSYDMIKKRFGIEDK